MARNGVVVVFDFDKTIIDCDSDDWVIEQLGVAGRFEELFPTMAWIPLMDRMMQELHLKGRSVGDIADCLRRAPLDSHVVTAIKAAYALGCDLRVVSDANRFFIETILEHHGLLQCFTEINTNPSYVDEHGRLRILPFHDYELCPHGCSLCPPNMYKILVSRLIFGCRLCPSNMCKGKIIERIRGSSFDGGKKRFIYLGDGIGDYCPSLKLSEGDHVMPRKDFPLWNRIVANPQRLKAEVHEWSKGEELEEVLLQLIHRSIASDQSSAQLLSADCKFENAPMAAGDERPLALRVPH